jgi:PAS domain S-box-containing protein
MGIRDLLDPRDLADFLATIESADGRQQVARVLRHRLKHRDPLHARITGHNVEVDGRRAFMVMAENVTDEVRTQQALERQQRQFHQLHQSLGEVLWMATPDGQRVLYVSPAFSAIYGVAAESMEADTTLWLRMVHPDDRDRARDSQQRLREHHDVVCEYRIVRPDGSIRWIEDRKRAIRDVDGTVLMIGGIAEDITARKERDAITQQLKSRLERLVGERTHELEQANLELDAFSRTVAHDLKSPLTGIFGLAQVLRMKFDAALGPQGMDHVEQIERSAREMSNMIHDLLAFSRAGSVELKRRWVDLAPLARALVDDLRRLEPHRRVEFECTAPLPASCDEGLMRSVLQNLIGNAWKFTANCPTAHIRVQAEGLDGHLHLTVSDDGCGFDAATVGDTFRPFQRFHDPAAFAGTGLGLVTCQRIVKRHGGQLHVASQPGAGTTVTLDLPGAAPMQGGAKDGAAGLPVAPPGDRAGEAVPGKAGAPQRDGSGLQGA